MFGNKIKNFQFPCLYCDDSFVFATASLIFLKLIQELCLSRIREKRMPLGAKPAENPQFGNP
jgi:hypothetical protein